jgi:CO/xanthine dehydrogenase FAD-binding subunit
MPFRFVAPTTSAEVFRHAREEGAVLLAGGSDLLHDIDFGFARPRVVVGLGRLPWRECAWNGELLTVGSTLPLSGLEDAPGLAERIPGLYTAVRAVGSRTLRHRATLGGNLGRSSPASDLTPVLLALEATVLLASSEGERTVPIDAFLRGPRTTELRPGELIRSISVPARPSVFLWQRVRPAQDISQVGVAVARHPGGRWAIALSGFPPRPIRSGAAEARLAGPAPSPEAIAAAAELAVEEAPFSTDRRASDEYRRRVVRVLLARAVGSLLGAGGGSRA